jgi:hypothetical protein
MAAREQRDQDLLDDLVLPDDDLPQLRENPLPAFRNLLCADRGGHYPSGN